MSRLPMTTQDNFSEYTVSKTLGLVKGNTVRSRNIARNLVAGIKTIFGGEISELTQAVSESREQALDRLNEEAVALGADGIVAIRIVASEAAEACTEILAFGTAVKFKR